MGNIEIYKKILMEDIEEKEYLGIPNYGPWYLNTKPYQDISKSFIEINDFIKEAIKDIPLLQGNNVKLEFINYGRTQLIFVIDVDDRRYTLVVNQPATKCGTSKVEFDNLTLLNKDNPHSVIKPIYYYKKDRQELYITPYVYKSRCIGVNTTKWGIWTPEPIYHFEDFNEYESIINSSMVALLISFYNEKDNLGIGSTRLDGGDFMLDKDYTYESSINKMKLIAARKLVNLSFDEYIDLLKKELTRKEAGVITLRPLRCPFNKKDVDKGIEMGLNIKAKVKKYETI